MCSRVLSLFKGGDPRPSLDNLLQCFTTITVKQGLIDLESQFQCGVSHEDDRLKTDRLSSPILERKKYFNKEIYVLVTSGVVHCCVVSASDY